MANSASRLTALLGNVSLIDDNEALKIASKALELSKNNVDALRTRVVALIKLDRFEDALGTLNDGGDKVAELCTLEKAYILYKIGKLTEAELLLQNTNKRGLKHVAAQVAYRAGKFTTAMGLYTDLYSKDSLIEGENIDLMVNISATDAQLEWQGNTNQMERENYESSSNNLKIFEISYNTACKNIASQNYKIASELLKRARDLCEASDEMSDEEKKSEILPIMLQQAYVLMELGNQIEAKTLLGLINVTGILEPSTKVIALNNFVATTTNKNPFMAQRILGSTPILSKSDQHFWYQANILQHNRMVIDTQAQKHSGVVRSTAKKLSNLFPTASSHHNLLSVLNASAHAKNKTGKPGLKAIIPLQEKRPKDVGLILIVVQLCVLANNIGQAIYRLESFLKSLEQSSVPEELDVRFAPGLIALQVSLYRLSGRKAPIRSTLSKAASYWFRRNKPVIPILHATIISLLQSHNPEDLSFVAELCKSMREKDPNDQIAMAGYIASFVSASFDMVSSEINKLTPVSQLISGIDTTALEDSGVPLLHIRSTQSSKKRNREGEKVPAKRRKLSKKRIPKNFEEGKRVDPERWLAKRDRSDYRPSTKKGKKKISELTQGGIIKEGGIIKDSENVGISSQKGIIKSEKVITAKAKKKRGKK